MTIRVVAPWFVCRQATAAPPGVDPGALARAMFEDLYDTLSTLELVDTAVVAAPGARDDVLPLLWPGAPVHEVSPPHVTDALSVLGASGVSAIVIVAADTPDLPPLLIGKAMRALGRADVAYCECAGGGLVFLAARCPLPDWVAGADPDLDDSDSRRRLHAAAPRRAAVAATPGWHRLRQPGDLASLDPGLEGWDVTRSLLAGRPISGRP